MKSGVTNNDLNSPEKLEVEVARILAKRKKRLGGAHNLSPAELRKLNGENHTEPIKKIILVTESTQTDSSVDAEKRPYHTYGDKYYAGDQHRDSFEDSRNFRISNNYRNSYEERSQNYTPPPSGVRRAASANTSPWALRREMFLDDDVPDFTSTTSGPYKSKPIPYQSTNSTTSIYGRDRYSQQTPPHQATNGTNKPLSEQITEQISKNVYYSDHHPTGYPSSAPSSPFFPHFSTTKQQQQPSSNLPNVPSLPHQNGQQQWQPEQLQQQLQQHQQEQQQSQSKQPQQPQQPQQTQQTQQAQPPQYSQPQQTQQPQPTQQIPQTQYLQPPTQQFRYQVSPENSEYFDTSKLPGNQSRPLSPLTSSYAVGDTDSVYSESGNEQDEEDYLEQEVYEPTVEDHVDLVVTGTELLMVMEKGMQKYHVAVNMPSMTKLVWSERGKVIGSQELKDVTEVSNLPHAIHPQLENLQWHAAVSGGPLSKWGESAWGTLGFSLTIKKSQKGASRRKKIDFVCSSHDIQQSWVVGLNALLHSKSQFQNGRRSTSIPFTLQNGAGGNEVEKVVAYLDKVMGMDETVVDKVAQLVEQKRRVIHSTSPPRREASTISKRSSMTILPVAPSYLTSPAPAPAPAPTPSFPAPAAQPVSAPVITLAPAPPAAVPQGAVGYAPPAQATQSAQPEIPTFTRSNTPTLPLVSRPPITRSNTSTGVMRVSPPGVKPRAPVARASSPLRRSLQLS